MIPRNARRLSATTLAMTALTALVAAPAQAQVKTDGQWRGAAGAALSTTSGNSTATAMALTAEMLRATADDKITLGASSNYARSKANGVTSTTANKWAGAGQYDWNLGPQLFVFGKLGLEGDEVAKLQLRSTLASGLGFKVFDSKPLSLQVFGGAAYTTDRYDGLQTIGGKTDDSFSRSSLLIGEESSHQLADNTTFKQRLEVYPGLSGDKAVLAKFTAGLSVAVSSSLNATLNVVNNHNSKPPVGFKKNDLGVFAGVNLRFGAP
jgi:putative salt-induced outer membrane protein